MGRQTSAPPAPATGYHERPDGTHLPLDVNLTRERRRWLADMLRSLLEAASDMAARRMERRADALDRHQEGAMDFRPDEYEETIKRGGRRQGVGCEAWE